jgi:hypothetical protein
VVINISITITYKNHYPSKYTPYQQLLFDRIKSYREDFVTPKRWFEIRKILTSEGLKSPLGKTLGNNHIMSIYKKGKIREDRLNSKVKVKKSLDIIEYDTDQITILD